MADVVYLNVGGVYFATLRSTLGNSESFFRGLVSTHRTEYFVDRDPCVFRYVLNWMRGCRTLPEESWALDELYVEADYYSLMDLKAAVMNTRRRFSMCDDLHAIASRMPAD